MLTLISGIGDYERVVPKLWGKELWVVNSRRYCLKKLILEPGKMSSLHYHKEKDETFHILIGECWLELDGKKRRLKPNQTVRITPGTPHKFWLEWGVDSPCIILEVSTFHAEEDVVRIEESKSLPKPKFMKDRNWERTTAALGWRDNQPG